MSRARPWYPLFAIVVSCILVSVGIGTMNVIYTQRQVHSAEQREAQARIESQRRWCALLVQLDTTLPTTSTIRPTIHNLREQFGC